GDKVHVKVNESAGYDVIIRRIEKAADGEEDAIRSF
ncbi:MAG: transcription elongation factor GreA, partial [Lachnospiraceae bacterium]|nr:transcription elongation factor GreA [Lachnospiraceae bacterium]